MKMSQAQFSNWGIVQWKTLTWAEYKKFEELSRTESPMAVANDIYRACIISGPTIFDATAGIIEFVVKDVYSSSVFSGSFDALNTKLNAKRQELNENFLLSARAVIAGLFRYKFEEIDEWDEETFLTRLAQAEFVAGKPLGMGKEEPVKEELVEQPTQEKKRIKEVSLAQQLVINRRNGR